MKKKTDTIKFTVDSENGLDIRSALPIPSQLNIAATMVELGTEVIQASLNETLRTVLSVLSQAPLEKGQLAVDEIEFSLLFSGSGEISILSVAKGGVEAQSGIRFKIKRSRTNVESS